MLTFIIYFQRVTIFISIVESEIIKTIKYANKENTVSGEFE